MPIPPPRRGSAVPGEEIVLAGRYRLERPLGRGGMAEVWAGHDEVLDRAVAVKLLSSRFHDDEQFQQRFRREAQHAASLNHPHVVAVYDTGTHDGQPFIVMELVHGRSLQHILERSELTEGRVLQIAIDVCGALAYAHERGLVHRDVKPGNILVADDGTVKVTDFGIARAATSDTVTQTAAILGTAAYLSPEQAQGLPVDARSDIYSLGIVLYEMLTGRQPFRGDSAVGIAYQHVQENPVPPREINPAVSTTAEAIAIKAMAKNPANRYASAREMADDLQRAHAGQTVTAPAVLLPDETAVLNREVSPAYPSPAPIQEQRRRTVGYLLLGVLAVLALVLAVWLLANVLGGGPSQLREVPAVTGKTYREAELVLRAAGLEATVAGDEYSDRFDEGLVLRQDPERGERVEDGTVVELTMSLGPTLVVVPKVEGLAEEAAIAELRDAGLPVERRIRTASDDITKGDVVGTDPGAGEKVRTGTRVTLILSAGPETSIVPAVEGLTESEARFRLEERGFKVRVSRRHSDDVDSGEVIDQDPEGNREARKGTAVTIVVSLGAEEPSPSPTPSPSPSPSPSPTEPTPSPTEAAGEPSVLPTA